MFGVGRRSAGGGSGGSSAGSGGVVAAEEIPRRKQSSGSSLRRVLCRGFNVLQKSPSPSPSSGGSSVTGSGMLITPPPPGVETSSSMGSLRSAGSAQIVPSFTFSGDTSESSLAVAASNGTTSPGSGTAGTPDIGGNPPPPASSRSAVLPKVEEPLPNQMPSTGQEEAGGGAKSSPKPMLARCQRPKSTTEIPVHVPGQPVRGKLRPPVRKQPNVGGGTTTGNTSGAPKPTGAVKPTFVRVPSPFEALLADGSLLTVDVFSSPASAASSSAASTSASGGSQNSVGASSTHSDRIVGYGGTGASGTGPHCDPATAHRRRLFAVLPQLSGPITGGSSGAVVTTGGSGGPLFVPERRMMPQIPRPRQQYYQQMLAQLQQQQQFHPPLLEAVDDEHLNASEGEGDTAPTAPGPVQRSISASPGSTYHHSHYQKQQSMYTNAGALNAPLLIPLGNRADRPGGDPQQIPPGTGTAEQLQLLQQRRRTTGAGSRGVTAGGLTGGGPGHVLRHRASVSGGGLTPGYFTGGVAGSPGFYGYTGVSAGGGVPMSAGVSPNLYLAARLDHPTVFDFEDWHQTLDKLVGTPTPGLPTGMMLQGGGYPGVHPGVGPGPHQRHVSFDHTGGGGGGIHSSPAFFASGTAGYGAFFQTPTGGGGVASPPLFQSQQSFFSPTSPNVSGGSGGGGPEFNTIFFESQEAVYSLFMKAHKAYDLIPNSSKLVVFDTELPVSKAFYALVYNGVRAAPLWDSAQQQFVGMLTITDFIQILHKYYRPPVEGAEGGGKGSGSSIGSMGEATAEGLKKLEEHKISTWREIFARDREAAGSTVKPMIVIDPAESLHRAVQLLCDHHIHRLPVLEQSTGNIFYILTHKRLIKFLYLYVNDLPKPQFMDKTPRELGIGCFEGTLTISKDTPLIKAMELLLTKRVSALPLVDAEGRVVDIYAKFDAINLAADKTYNNLDVTVHEALQHRSDWFEGVRKCSVTDSLWTVVEAIVKAEVHRLVVVDEGDRVVGIVSLSDILRFLVLNPVAPPTSATSGTTPTAPPAEEGNQQEKVERMNID